MNKLNLATRTEMFTICASIEYDLKKFIIDSSIKQLELSEEMLKKIDSRDKNAKTDEDKLNQLDLGDYIEIIAKSPYEFKITNENATILRSYFNSIIPVRNRVMHTKPLEIGDRGLLIEVIDGIDNKISFIKWREILTVRDKLIKDKNSLLTYKYNSVKEYNTRVLHNLPLPEFDDTGFVGRKKDLKEITELLLNKKNQVISVVGNGGLGKTATVIKVLYDLLENPSNTFEAIIWISLKTKTLSNGEFVEIKNSIKTVSEVLVKSEREMINMDCSNPVSSIINFMSEFKVLLVLDNLETINSGEINSFIRQIPENSKILITSRLGIGEFEIRQRIEGLTKSDGVTYYRELSKYYGLDTYKQKDDEIYYIVNNNLYNNPLSIKWYISGLYAGTSSNEMLNHKDELVEFCISNVFEKLSSISKKVLQLFLLQDAKLTYGLIDFYIDTNDDGIILKNSINELLSTYMIQASSGNYIMNDMSREYISLKYPPTNEFVKEISAKKKKINEILQHQKVFNENTPFNPNVVSPNKNSIDEKISAYHLTKALEYGKERKWNDVDYEINKAYNTEPNYFEVYKVKAFLLAERDELY